MDKRKPFQLAGIAVALGTVVAPMAISGTGCDSNPLEAICCSDFKPGTDMLNVDWEIDDPVASARFAVAIQAIGDFSGAATAMVTDLGTLCRNMAVELGEDPKSVDTDDPGDFATQWCGKAAAQITAIRGDLTISYQPAQCTISADVQASCEAHCDVEGGCDPGSVEVRCTSGELSVKCEGTCEGHCDGSANVAVNCSGGCEGSCEGTCDGTAVSGSCSGVCEGKCRGSCEVDAAAMVECDGECRGSCTGTATAPKCTGTLDPPECDLDVDCQAGCDASASAKAECTPPAVTIEGAAEFSLQIAVLKKYLPEIISIADARARLLVDQVEAMIDVSGGLEGAVGSGKASFCLLPAGAAIIDAGENINTSFAASGSVVAAIQ